MTTTKSKKISKKINKKSAGKKSAVKKTKTSAAPKAKMKTMGIGTFCKDLIMSGKYSRDEVIAKSQKEYPDSAVNNKHVSFYIWALKKDKQEVPAFKD